MSRKSNKVPVVMLLLLDGRETGDRKVIGALGSVYRSREGIEEAVERIEAACQQHYNALAVVEDRGKTRELLTRSFGPQGTMNSVDLNVSLVSNEDDVDEYPCVEVHYLPIFTSIQDAKDFI